jgi:hypothetical protein
MGFERFSPAFQRFVRDNIASVEQVDVLLLLAEQRDRAWTIAELSKTLSSSTPSIARRLAVLLRRGLVARADDGRFRYSADETAGVLVDQVRDEYATRPVSVIGLIYSERTSALESFSDAFLLGGEERDS